MNRPLLAFVFLAAGCVRADIILSVAPANQTVPLGTPVGFDINISGLGSGTALGTYDINFGFDPALFSYSGIAFGDQLDLFGLGDIQSTTLGSGTIEVFELSLESIADLNSLQAPFFRLATLTFDTLAVGSSSPVKLSVNALSDAFGNSLAANIQNGSVTIGPTVSLVPEPSALSMLLIAVAVPSLMGSIRRKQQCSKR